MAELKTPNKNAEQLITEHLDIWTTAIEQKSSSGRGSSKKFSLHGIKKLRELILDLAVRGKLVPQESIGESIAELSNRNFEIQKELLNQKSLKTKADIKIFQSDEFLDVPLTWGRIKLGNLAKFIDYRGKTPNKIESGVRLITAKNVKFGFISLSPEEFISEEEYNSWMTRGFPKVGDLLFTPEAPLGNIAQVNIEEKFALAQRAICLQLHLPELSDYLKFFIMSPTFQEQLLSKATGTTAKGIKASVLKELVIYLPPIEEQSRIVAKVDELMSLCDALETQTESSIAAHQTLVEVLLEAMLKASEQTVTPEQATAQFQQNWQRLSEHFDTLFTTTASIDTLKQTILQLAVMGKLVPQNPNDEPAAKLLERIAAEKAQLIKDKKIKKQKPLPKITDEEKPFELPHNWEWCRLGDSGLGSTGKTPSTKRSDFFDGDIPFIGPGQITPSGKIIESEKFLTEAGIQYSTEALPGDILMVCIGGSIGKSALVTERAAFNQQINCISPLYINSSFLYRALSSKSFYKNLLEKATGSATPIINRGKWEELLVPIPPVHEQHRIVAKVDELISLCDQLKARLTDAQTTKLHLTDAIVEQAL